MKDYKKILKLLGEGKSQLGISCEMGISWNTVHDIREKAKAANLPYEKAKDMDNSHIQQLINRKREKSEEYLQPDFEKVHDELALPHVTLENIFSTYSAEAARQGKKPYSRTQFHDLYTGFYTVQKVSGHVGAKPARSTQLDFAGDKLSYFDRAAGVIVSVVLFVATLSFSKLVYVEAILNQGAVCFAQALMDAWAYFKGCTAVTIVDNTKAAVILHTKYEIAQLHSIFEEMSRHYGYTVVAAPAYSPKSKPDVEASVHLSYIKIIAPLRHNRYFSLASLNDALWKEMDRFNREPFKEHPQWSRMSLFQREEYGLLKKLPDSSYEIRQITTATVRSNSHAKCKIDGYYYSVPYHYIGKMVTIKFGKLDVEICNEDGIRICTHPRGTSVYDFYVTDRNHLPSYIAEYTGRNEQQYLFLANQIGDGTKEVVSRIFDHANELGEAPEKYYETATGIIHLGNKKVNGERIGNGTVEKACGILISSFPSHSSVIRYTKLMRTAVALAEAAYELRTEQAVKEMVSDEQPDLFPIDLSCDIGGSR